PGSAATNVTAIGSRASIAVIVATVAYVTTRRGATSEGEAAGVTASPPGMLRECSAGWLMSAPAHGGISAKRHTRNAICEIGPNAQWISTIGTALRLRPAAEPKPYSRW